MKLIQQPKKRKSKPTGGGMGLANSLPQKKGWWPAGPWEIPNGDDKAFQRILLAEGAQKKGPAGGKVRRQPARRGRPGRAVV